MTVKEARKLIAVFMVTYPNYKPIDVELAATVWADATKEYTYEEVDLALKSYMQTSTTGFAPAPGQLIEKIHAIKQPQELNEMEAWALVSKAIRNSGYNSVEEYAKLPPVVQKSVGLPDQLRIWAVDENYNEEVVMSQFQRCYRSELKRQEEFQKMPSDVQRIIQNTCETSPKAQIQEKRDFLIKSSLEDKNTLKIENKSIGVSKHIEEKLEEMRGEMS